MSIMKAANQSGDIERTKAPTLRIIKWKLFNSVIFALFAVYGFYLTLFHAKWATVALGEYVLFLQGHRLFLCAKKACSILSAAKGHQILIKRNIEL
jgi:hypothetical protein